MSISRKGLIASTLIALVAGTLLGFSISYYFFPRVVKEKYTPTKPYEGVVLSVILTDPMVTSVLDAKFEERTGAKLKLTILGWADYRTKLVTALAAKSSEYDVFILPNEWAAEFGEAGWYVPLEEYFTKEEKEDLLEVALEMYTYKGHLSAMVTQVMPNIWFYNEKMLTDAGFTQPARTWDEFEMQVKKMQQMGLCRYGTTWPLSTKASGLYWVSNSILMSHEGLENYGGIFDEKNKMKPYLNTSQAVETLKWLVGTIGSIASPASIEYDKTASLAPFMAGENPYNHNWQFMYPMTVDPKTSKIANYSQYCLIPAGKTGKTAAISAGGAYAVSPFSKNKEAALAYAKFITSKENALWCFQVKGWLPWWKSFYKDPEILKIQPQLPLILEQMKYSRPYPVIVWYEKFLQTFITECAKALIGQKTPKQALDDAQAAVMKIWSGT